MKKSRSQQSVRPFDVVIYTVCVAVIVMTVTLLWSRYASQEGSGCPDNIRDITVTLKGDRFEPSTIMARRCDRIIFRNQDTVDYRPAIGMHERHVAYPGFSVTTLRPGDSYYFRAWQPGGYVLHDHIRDRAYADLLISE